MSYSSDQFFKFDAYEGGNASIKRQAVDNPYFLFPNNPVPPIYGRRSDGSEVDRKMQRGFMRGIFPSAVQQNATSKLAVRRLFFQFNPEFIQRSVAMNANVGLPLLQDPNQLFQPVNGNATFNFELVFDRQMEVNTGRLRTENGSRQAEDLLSSKGLAGYGEKWNQDDVAQIGVLADLYVLDSIIGQSITPDMRDFIQQYWTSVNTYQNNNLAEGEKETVLNPTEFSKNIAKNYGNSAFLAPLPVRIVFSSLFMVEGFVESSTVLFTKFSSQYVPTVCKVGLQLRVVYMGFARQDAYLTDSINNFIKQTVEDSKTIGALQKLLEKKPPYFHYQSIRLDALGDTNSDAQTTSGVYIYDTFKEFWNGAYQGTGDASNWDITGVVKTATPKELSTVVEDKGVYWSINARLEMYRFSVNIPKPKNGEGEEKIVKNGTTIYGKKLIDSPITFYRMSKDDVVSSEDMGTNANKKHADGDFQSNRWKASGNPYLANVTESDTDGNELLDGDFIKFRFINEYVITTGATTGESQVTITKSMTSDLFQAVDTVFWNKIREKKFSCYFKPAE